ncbi:hypothetical protein [Haloferula sp.]|uniref:hypothetical protein n=1 Tax=Haloferula sp. TaxID=2497595 RepID=UPI00329C004C
MHTLSICKASCISLLTSAACLVPALAGPETAPEISPEKSIPDWVPSFGAGYLHQFDADLDRGGSFSVDRAILRAGISRVFDRDRSIGVSLGYGYDGYSFDNLVPEPWSDIHTLRLGLPVRWALGDRWSLFGIPTIRSSVESGASFSDGITGGFIGGASYEFSDRLSIGPGVGVLSQLEDDASVFPILVINWKITDSLSLETGRGYGASQGPGLLLKWQASERWNFVFGSRYEKLRFQLDDLGVAPGGVGEERGIPVYLGASYSLSRFSELSIYGGAKFGGSIAVDNQFGNRVARTDFDVAPFAGLTWRMGF